MGTDQAFKEGDKVRLAIGGPVMIVSHAYVRDPTEELIAGGSRPQKLDCQWFIGKKLEKGTFSAATLVHVSDEEAAAEAKGK